MFERRLADRVGGGRVWLAGDAAHITGPVGAQSMNVGLREAHELADAIASARGGAGTAAFAAYDAGRKREWERLLAPGVVAATADATAWARKRAERILPCVPASGAHLTTLLAQLGLTYGASSGG
jgi:2-polyprenyl-6-methoxyphenol hydroxylase-like FAD-dependent oxidoreductase